MPFDPLQSETATETVDPFQTITGGNPEPVSGVIDITGERQGAFGLAMATASKGDRILYHVGEHCAGAHKKDARAAFEGGSVLLTMRKLDRFIFEYLAIPLASKGA